MLFLISYDLKKPEADYLRLTRELVRLRARRALPSQWLLVHNATARALRDHLLWFVDESDVIWVQELAEQSAWKESGLHISDVEMRTILKAA